MEQCVCVCQVMTHCIATDYSLHIVIVSHIVANFSKLVSETLIFDRTHYFLDTPTNFMTTPITIRPGVVTNIFL